VAEGEKITEKTYSVNHKEKGLGRRWRNTSDH
jgi:hypothetical protein